MREIFFKGKRIDNGEWVEGESINTQYDMNGKKHIYIGVLFSSERTPLMQNVEWHEVIPETVGQYTGLTVPSGKIFEHDIVTAKFKSNGARFNFAVKYSNENGCYVFDNGHVKVPFNHIRSVRIIGNIHDNPELLGNE